MDWRYCKCYGSAKNTMNYKEYVSLFKKHLETLSYQKKVDLALIVCKELYPDYVKFVEVHQWGNADLLRDAIALCEQGQSGLVDEVAIEKMVPKVDAVVPDTDDFGDAIGSYGLNASAAVFETLQFLISKEDARIYDIGIYFTDTVDFKIQEKENVSESSLEDHPLMVEAWNFILTLSR